MGTSWDETFDLLKAPDGIEYSGDPWECLTDAEREEAEAAWADLGAALRQDYELVEAGIG